MCEGDVDGGHGWCVKVVWGGSKGCVGRSTGVWARGVSEGVLECGQGVCLKEYWSVGKGCV